MNKNDQEFLVQKIRTQYTEKEHTSLDELKALDRKVKRPANVFAYVFGSISAIIMGAGMSLVMTEIGSIVGIGDPMIPGIVFLIMNLALALIIFFMVYWNRTFHRHEITTIALAAYTFTSLAFAIVNTMKYRKYNSPVYSASKAISLAAACVSMLTLESTMLTTFGDGTMSLTGRRILLGASGGVISAGIIAMAIYMIVQGTKKIRLQKTAKE